MLISTDVKSFIVQPPGTSIINLFCNIIVCQSCIFITVTFTRLIFVGKARRQ